MFAPAMLFTHAFLSTDAFGSAVALGITYVGASASAQSVAYVLEITGIYRIRQMV